MQQQNFDEYKLQNEFQNFFKRQINFIRFDKINNNLILIGDEKIIKIIKNNEIIKEINNEEYILSIKVSSQLSKIYIGGYNYLKIYNINENYVLEHKIPKNNLGFNDIHIFDNYITVADGDKLFIFNYLKKYKIYKKLELENNIKFFRIINNMLIISDGNLYFYNLTTFKLIKTFYSKTIYSFNFIYFYENIIYTNEKDKEITLINIKDLKILNSFKIDFNGIKISVKNNYLYLSNLKNLFIFNKEDLSIYQKFNLNNKFISEFKLIENKLYLINSDNKLLLLKKLKKNNYKKGLVIKNKKSKEKLMNKKIIEKIIIIENKLKSLEKLIIDNKFNFEVFQKKILNLINDKIGSFEDKINILKKEKINKSKKNNFYSPNIKIKTKNVLNQTINKSFDVNQNEIFTNIKKRNTNNNDKFLKIISKKLKRNFKNSTFKKNEIPIKIKNNKKIDFPKKNNYNNNKLEIDDSIFSWSSQADNENKGKIYKKDEYMDSKKYIINKIDKNK